MKVKKSSFSEFLRLLAVKGEIENKELILNGNGNALEALTITPLKTVSVYGVYKVLGAEKISFGIGNMKLLDDFVNIFDEEEIEIIKDNNELVMKDNDKRNSLSYILTSPEYIKNSLDLKKFNEIKKKAEGNEFILSPESISKIVKCYKTVNNGDIFLSNKGKNLVISLEHNKNKILAEFKTGIKEDFSVRVSGLLVDILSSVNGSILISIKNDSPIKIFTSSKDYEVEYLLALMKK
jgi:hypothetical protein